MSTKQNQVKRSEPMPDFIPLTSEKVYTYVRNDTPGSMQLIRVPKEDIQPQVTLTGSMRYFQYK